MRISFPVGLLANWLGAWREYLCPRGFLIPPCIDLSKSQGKVGKCLCLWDTVLMLGQNSRDRSRAVKLEDNKSLKFLELKGALSNSLEMSQQWKQLCFYLRWPISGLISSIRQYFLLENKYTVKGSTFWILQMHDVTPFSQTQNISYHNFHCLVEHTSLNSYYMVKKKMWLKRLFPPCAHCCSPYTDMSKIWRTTSFNWSHSITPFCHFSYCFVLKLVSVLLERGYNPT